MTPLAHYLRMWDYASAARVDDFAANSENVRRRIWKTYRRESVVIPPPVAVETFYNRPPEDYYLVVSELVTYKRVDSAVRVFSKNGRKLRVAGDGPEFKSLRRQASAGVEFCGRVSDQELRELYSRCRALVLPGEEDFGITAVEALASGKPVIALGRGGALETVPLCEPRGGLLYGEDTDDSLAQAVELWDAREKEADAEALQRWAAKYSESAFRSNMNRLLFPGD
jgi:glycosyltransferase involved in cell wall biosynthesis